MIGYVTIGVWDMEKAKKFYCDLFEEQGSKIVIDAGRIAFIGTKSRGPMVAVCEPYDKQDPHPGNGTMIAFTAENKEEIDAWLIGEPDLSDEYLERQFNDQLLQNRKVGS